MTRYFYFLCPSCPTRITVETEVVHDSDDGPEYAGASFNGVGLARARQPTEHDDGTEVADLCPACGGELCDLDEIVLRDEFPMNTAITPENHAAWRQRRASGR